MLVLIFILFFLQVTSGQVPPSNVTTLVRCNSGIPCLKVGFTYPTNAALQIQGYQMRKGYMYWAQAANGGGILSNGTRYNIELLAYDDRGNATLTDLYYKQLILNNTVDFLLGPYASSLTLVSNSVANSLGKLIVFGSGVAENLFSFGYPMIFGVSTTATHYTKSGLEALQLLGAQSVSIIYGTATFSAEVVNGTLEYIAAKNMTLVGQPLLFANASEQVLTPILNTIKSYNPDVLIAAGLLPDGESIVRVAKKVGLRPKALYLTSAPSELQFIQDLKGDAEYIMGPSQWHRTLPFSDTYFGSASDYADTFITRMNESTVTYTSAQASAAGLVLQMGIEKAASLSQQDVAFAISNVKTKTFFGPIQFDNTGENVAKPMFTVQIQSGNIEVVAPDGAKTKLMVYPIPWSQLSTSGTNTTETSGSQTGTTNSPCLSNCNGPTNGVCVNGECHCLDEWSGSDCSEELSNSYHVQLNFALITIVVVLCLWS